MAKIVIAGKADCPYFARAELLGDKLNINLPDFKLHKIIKRPEEWQNWLSSTCDTRGWSHDKSPLIWRELIDRGGKGVLIGGANEFQEYAKGYYDIESDLISNDMQKIANENLQYKVDIDEEEADYKALSKPLHVCVTCASSPVCYALLNSIGQGKVFGENTEIIFHLQDSSENMEVVEGVKMETEDLAHGLVRGIELETDIKAAFKDCDAILLLDDILQGDMTKEEWIKANADRFISYAKAIDEVAKKTVKVLIAGYGPVNFNAFIMIKNAPSVPRQNIAAMSRMTENRYKAVIADRLKVNTAGVVDLIVWGDPNGGHYADVGICRVHGYDGAIIGPESFSVSAPEMVFDKAWLDGEYLEQARARKITSENLMRHSASMSIAAAIASTFRHWFNGSPSGQMFSLGICSEGWYGVPKDIVYSFPVTFHPKGYWNVVQDIDLHEEAKAIIQKTVEDLEAQIDVIFPRPKPPISEAAKDSLSSDADSNRSGNQSSDDDKKDGDDAQSDGRLETILEDKERELSQNVISDQDSAKKTDTEGEKSEGEKKEEGAAGEVSEKEVKGETSDEKEPQLPTE